MARELVVLGTASQAPTRTRNHNGYLLRWDDLGILLDPGEGTQRQMLLAGVRSSMITHIAITHEHGDHCLGLPGVLQRMVLDQRRDPVTLIHPQAATAFVDLLLQVAMVQPGLGLVRHRVDDAGMDLPLGAERVLRARPLDHRVPTIGYRLQAPDTRRFHPSALAEAGLEGPIVGRLKAEGQVEVDGRVHRLQDLSEEVSGQSAAFIMDTRPCEAAKVLLADVDLGIVETTFQDGEEALASKYGHMTATQAGRLAAEAGVRKLVVTHFSQRHPDSETFRQQASAHHDCVVAATDLMRIEVPRPKVTS